jgi:uncharacterized protein (UPF0335 family)
MWRNFSLAKAKNFCYKHCSLIFLGEFKMDETQVKAEVGGVATERLRSLIERIERLEEEKKGIQGDIRDIFAEAKSAGFDVKAMRTILKLRKMNAADREEAETIVEVYRKALDM